MFKNKINIVPPLFIMLFSLLIPLSISAEGNQDRNDEYLSTNYGDYLEVINDEAIVYDNSGKKLIKIGRLLEGETYPIARDYGNWHQIKFGSLYGYVHKKNTNPGSANAINNLNKIYKTSGELIRATSNLSVYDNSSGKLIPFVELENGMEYEIVSDYDNWYRVLFADRIGYIKKASVVKLPPKDSDFFEVLAENTPVYDNRTGKLLIVGTLQKGQVYKRVGDYGNWHRIQFGDFYGYVSKSLTIQSKGETVRNINKSYKNSSEKFSVRVDTTVYDNTGQGLEPFASLKAGTVFPIVSDYGNWYRIIVSGRVGYIKKEHLDSYFLPGSKYFEVEQNGLAIYDNRKGSLKKVGELIKGQVYERVSDYGNWHRIQFGNHYGYVKKSSTLSSFGNQIPNPNNNYHNGEITLTTTGKAMVYDNSSGKLVHFAIMEKGIKHPIVSDYGNWYRILVANRVGYINKDSVSISFTKDMKYFKVLEENLPIYDNRGGGLVKVGELVKGQTYERISDYGNWHRIQFGNYYGYVKKSNTEPSIVPSFRNIKLRNNMAAIVTPKEEVAVYDNTGNKLVAFAKLEKGKEYPGVRDYGKWYEINIAGRYGYVSKANVDVRSIAKNIVNPRQVYTYEQMERDIFELARNYPDLITWITIGKSVDGRKLYAMKLGTGKKEVYFNASTHAREWITTNILMEMIDEYSQAYVKNQTYGGYNVKQILDNTSIWFVPMVNPDGVTLVQKGPYSFSNPVELISLNKGSTEFRAWKANIRGIDLNRQYPVEWDTITNDPGRPGPYNFKGYKPLTEPEAISLLNFSKAHNFKTEVTYHSSGQMIYFGDDVFTPGSYMYNLSKEIASMVSAQTGYRLAYTRGTPGGGTYTDFVQHVMNRVGLTPEVSKYVGNRPVPITSFDSIWRKNSTVGLMIAKEAYTR